MLWLEDFEESFVSPWFFSYKKLINAVFGACLWVSLISLLAEGPTYYMLWLLLEGMEILIGKKHP
jgi:hypothetical protein